MFKGGCWSAGSRIPAARFRDWHIDALDASESIPVVVCASAGAASVLVRLDAVAQPAAPVPGGGVPHPGVRTRRLLAATGAADVGAGLGGNRPAVMAGAVVSGSFAPRLRLRPPLHAPLRGAARYRRRSPWDGERRRWRGAGGAVSVDPSC